ncbi:hypothetical protein ACA910_001167 [Epithemia clementina (nom. ined.)]
METSSIGIPAVWEHSLTNLLGHGPDSSIGINLRLWVIHQQFSNDLTEFCAWELHDFDLDTNALHRGTMTYLAHHHSMPSPFLQLLLPNQVKQLHGLWQYIVHQSMTDSPTLDGTIPSLQPDHWIATTITTFRQWLVTFHHGLNNSTSVDISRGSPAMLHISHHMPSISHPTLRVFHHTQSIQITPAPIQVSIPYQHVAPSFPLDISPISLSQDGGEVSHTKWYEDCPSINKSWDPSSIDAANKPTNVDVDEEEQDHFVEIVSPHTSHHETCHSTTQDSIHSEYFDAYQQLQHIIANKHCNPDFTFMSDNIADIKNVVQQWGDPSLNKPSCTNTSFTENAAQDTNANMINLQTIADDDPIHDTLLSCYGEIIIGNNIWGVNSYSDTNNGKDIIIGNYIWGVNSTSVSIAGESPNQGHDYGEPITIGNKLWGAPLPYQNDDTSFIKGETILIDKKLWGTLFPSSYVMCQWLVASKHELDNSISVDIPTSSSTLSRVSNTTPHVYHSASHVFPSYHTDFFLWFQFIHLSTNLGVHLSLVILK